MASGIAMVSKSSDRTQQPNLLHTPNAVRNQFRVHVTSTGDHIVQ